ITHGLAERWIDAAGKTSLRITESGRTVLATALDAKVPAKPSWKTLTQLAMARGLSLEDSSTVRSAEALRVTLAARAQGIALRGKPTEARLKDRLTWKALGIDSEQRVTKASLQRILFARLLEVPDLASAESAVSLLAAREAGAKAGTPRELRTAALERFLFTPSKSPSAGGTFAESVLRVARTLPAEARFGE